MDNDEIVTYLDTDKFYTGWVDDQEAVGQVVAQMQYTDIAQTPIGDIPLEQLPKECFLWLHCNKAMGQHDLKVENQGNVGSCVSFGTARAIEYTNIVEIANGDPEEFKYLNRPIIYGGSRFEIGGNNQRSPFRGDGSIGAWAAKWATNFGVLDQAVYGKYDLTQYSPTICREWGSKGIPNDLEPLCAMHKISNATLVKTVEDAIRALSNGFAFSICSNQGFNTRRDSNGVCQPSGSWAHCMMCKGYTYINNVLHFVIENSWGTYMGTGNPVSQGCNLGSFMCKDTVMASILRQNDSWAFAGLAGFNRKDIDWKF